MAMVYDYNAGIKAPKLRLDDGCSLAELRNFALRAGFKGVMKYNNKEAILRDIYRHINVVREERKAPDDRVKKHTRVTDAYRDVNDIADIFGFSGRGDIYDFDRSWDDTLRMFNFCQFVQAFVRHGDNTYVRLDRTERKVGRLCFRVR